MMKFNCFQVKTDSPPELLFMAERSRMKDIGPLE